MSDACHPCHCWSCRATHDEDEQLDSFEAGLIAGSLEATGYAECKRRAVCVVNELSGEWAGRAAKLGDYATDFFKADMRVALSTIHDAIAAIEKL